MLDRVPVELQSQIFVTLRSKYALSLSRVSRAIRALTIRILFEEVKLSFEDEDEVLSYRKKLRGISAAQHITDAIQSLKVKGPGYHHYEAEEHSAEFPEYALQNGERFFAFISKLPNLRSLGIYGLFISPAAHSSINSLSNLRKLTVLKSLCSEEVTTPLTVPITSVVLGDQVNLEGGDDTCTVLIQNLREKIFPIFLAPPTIRDLTIFTYRMNEFEPERLLHMWDALPKNPNLRSLRIEGHCTVGLGGNLYTRYPSIECLWVLHESEGADDNEIFDYDHDVSEEDEYDDDIGGFVDSDSDEGGHSRDKRPLDSKPSNLFPNLKYYKGPPFTMKKICSRSSVAHFALSEPHLSLVKMINAIKYHAISLDLTHQVTEWKKVGNKTLRGISKCTKLRALALGYPDIATFEEISTQLVLPASIEMLNVKLGIWRSDPKACKEFIQRFGAYLQSFSKYKSLTLVTFDLIKADPLSLVRKKTIKTLSGNPQTMQNLTDSITFDQWRERELASTGTSS